MNSPALSIKRFSLACLLVGLMLLTPIAARAGTPTATDLRPLMPGLASPDAGTRLAAARRLAVHGQSAMTSLTRLLQEGTVREQRGAVVGLTLLPHPALAMETFLNSLASDDTTVRSLAAHGLALSGRSALTPLTDRLVSSDPRIRDSAAYALTLMRTDAVPALTSLLESEDTFTRAKAAWILGRMGRDALSAVPALIRALPCDDLRAMHVVAEAIDLIGPSPQVVAYHLMLINVRPGNPVGRLGHEAAPTLTRLLARPGTPLGQAAFRALARIGKDAEQPLRHALATGTRSQKAGAALLLLPIDPGVIRTLPEPIRASLSGAEPKQQ